MRTTPRPAAPRRPRTLALLVVSLALGVLGTAAAPAQATMPLGWGEPFRTVVPEELSDISCPTDRLCVSMAGSDVATTTDPRGGASTWRLARASFPPGCGGERPCRTDPHDIDCPTERLCVAISGDRIYTSIEPTAGTPWRSVRIELPDGMYALDCASEALCVAVGEAGIGAVSTDPTGKADAWRAVRISADDCSGGCAAYGGGVVHADVFSISCPSAELCVAGDTAGNVLATTDPDADQGPWRTVARTPNRESCRNTGCAAAIDHVACASATRCVALDESGYVLTSTRPAGGATAWELKDGGHRAFRRNLTCPTVSRCLATWGGRAYVGDDPYGTTPWDVQPVTDEDDGLTGLACPTVDLCVAILRGGRAVVGQLLTRPQIAGQLRAQLAPRPDRARIGTVLRRGGYGLALSTPSTGAVEVRWRAKSGPRTTVAVGRRDADADAVAGTVRLRLTRYGRRLLRGRSSVRLAAQVLYRTRGGETVVATRNVRLRR